MKKAQEFITLWTYLGDHHKELDEEALTQTEQKLFELKTKLTNTDIPYIMEHIEQNKLIQKAMLHFLR